MAKKLAGSSATYSHQNASKYLTRKLDVWGSFWHENRCHSRIFQWSKRVKNFKREIVFWDFGAQFWMIAIFWFLNGPTSDVFTFQNILIRSHRLCNKNKNIAWRSQDRSKDAQWTLKNHVFCFHGQSMVALIAFRSLSYWIITAAL